MLSSTSTGAPGRDLVADGRAGWRRRARVRENADAALVAADPVGDAVDLDQVDGPVGGGDEAVRRPLTTIGRWTVDALELGVDGHAVPGRSATATRNRAGPVRNTVTL